MSAKGGLEACLGLAVVDTGAVQDQHGLTLTVLDVVHRDVTNLALHAATLIRLHGLRRATPLGRVAEEV